MFEIVPFITYIFVVAFTPGPNNILSLINANKSGYRKTVKFLFGISTGFLIIMLLANHCYLLLSRIVPGMKNYMGILGAVYMTYLAVNLMTSKFQGQNNIRQFNSFYTGILLQFINAKSIIFCITVAANFIVPYFKSNITILLFSLLITSLVFIATSCWALFGTIFREFLAKFEKPVNFTLGILLLYCAYSLSGISDLLSIR